jgi:hypothetical protein
MVRQNTPPFIARQPTIDPELTPTGVNYWSVRRNNGRRSPLIRDPSAEPAIPMNSFRTFTRD